MLTLKEVLLLCVHWYDVGELPMQWQGYIILLQQVLLSNFLSCSSLRILNHFIIERMVLWAPLHSWRNWGSERGTNQQDVERRGAPSLSSAPAYINSAHFRAWNRIGSHQTRKRGVSCIPTFKEKVLEIAEITALTDTVLLLQLLNANQSAAGPLLCTRW